jgi:hypothetical protein
MVAERKMRMTRSGHIFSGLELGSLPTNGAIQPGGRRGAARRSAAADGGIQERRRLFFFFGCALLLVGSGGGGWVGPAVGELGWETSAAMAGGSLPLPLQEFSPEAYSLTSTQAAT